MSEFCWHQRPALVVRMWYNIQMKFRQSLFWDVDPTTIDEEKNARYIIERILDLGDSQEISWMFKRYPREKIASVFRLPRSQVDPKSRALWDLILK